MAQGTIKAITRLAVLAACMCVAACAADSDNTQASGSGKNVFGNSAGTTGSAGFGSVGGGGTNATGGAGTGDFGMGCASANIQAARVTPTIWLVVDGSGSMDEQFGNSTRWVALREALMAAQGGVVPTLQAAVVWGLVEYDGPIDFGSFIPGLFGGGADAGTATTACPRLVVVEPMLNNFANMDAAYPQMPLGGSTPTHKALDAVLTRLTNPPPVLDQNVGPTYVVLATDGQPNDFCSNGVPDAAAAVLQSTTNIAATGTQMFVISLAGNDAQLQAHLEQVAMAGGTGKPPFTPMNKDDLVKTFEEIIGGAVGCEVRLNGKVVLGSECQGYVKVNGTNLVCNDPNGWRLKDEQTVEIVGTACDAFKQDSMAQLIANFPCGVFVPD